LRAFAKPNRNAVKNHYPFFVSFVQNQTLLLFPTAAFQRTEVAFRDADTPH
jgi:hypothetical protein